MSRHVCHRHQIKTNGRNFFLQIARNVRIDARQIFNRNGDGTKTKLSITVTEMKPTLNYHNTMLGYFGEPKAPAYFARAVSFYSKLFLSPFTVSWSECQRAYKLSGANNVQKILFSLFVFGNVISFLYWVTTSVRELEELSRLGETITVGVLILLCLLLTWLSVTSVIVIVWLRQGEILEFFRALEDSIDVLRLPSVLVWLCPLLFYCASSVTNLYSTTGQITVSEGAQMVTNGIVCILQRLGLFPVRFGEDGLCGGIVNCIQIFFKVIIFHGGCFCSMPHTLLLTLSLGLRQIGKEVKRTMELGGTIPVDEGLRVYERLKGITNKANEVFGSVILTHYLCNLTYAIQTPFLFSEVGHAVEDLNYLLWLFVSALIWWIGSEFHRLVHNAFKSWIQASLSKEMSLDDRLKLSILSNTIDKDAIGLYCRYFTVTHRFLTTTCGAVITYGIIVLQVQMQQIEICRGENN